MCLRVLLLLFINVSVAVAQQFSSGSTGVDGALDLTAGDRMVQLPPLGILNYTTVNIPAGRTLTFQNNLKNTPVVLLAQGTVNIAGAINISATANVPGPGGFYGGDPGRSGLFPGAGLAEQGGQWVGPLNLFPIIGGGGGGGHTGQGCGYYANPWGPSITGGGGGGAIVIASTATVNLSGSIQANGSNIGVQTCFWTFTGTTGGAGAVRIVANSISQTGTIAAAVVRLEAPTGQVNYAGSGTAPVIAPINPSITPSKAPSINIVSIGGYPVPSYSGSSFSTIDLLLPTQLQDPIPVVVQGINVPVGSPVTINFSGSASATSTTANLVGTVAASAATVYISNVDRGAVTYMFVSASFDPTLISLNRGDEPNAVSRIVLAAAPASRTRYTFLRRDGSEISIDNLSADIRRALGL